MYISYVFTYIYIYISPYRELDLYQFLCVCVCFVFVYRVPVKRQIDSRTRTVGVWVEGTDPGKENGLENGTDGDPDGQGREAAPLVSVSPTEAVLPGMPHQFGRGIVYYLHGSQVRILWEEWGRAGHDRVRLAGQYYNVVNIIFSTSSHWPDFSGPWSQG